MPWYISFREMRSGEERDIRLCGGKARLTLCYTVSESYTVTLAEHIKATSACLRIKLCMKTKEWSIYTICVRADWHHLNTYTLCSNVERGKQKIWKEMSCWWVTIIVRRSLSMAASGWKCWSPHCVLTPYALRTNTAVDVRGEMASRSRWRTSNGEVSDAAEWAPVSPKSVQLSCCIHNTMYFPQHSTQI